MRWKSSRSARPWPFTQRRSTVIFIATLFVIGEGLDASGVTTWAGQQLSARTGGSRSRLLIFTMLLVAGLTALISLNGAVAALLPVVILKAIRNGPPSQLLMPMVFAAHAGSPLTMTGTPVNVLMADVAANATSRAFGFFEFAIMGVPLLLGTIAIVVAFGKRLLPHRNARTIPADLSALARTLMDQYAIDEGPVRTPDTLFTPDRGVAEVVIPPRSALLGASVSPGMVSNSGDFVILAMQRGGAEVTKETALEVGDILLLRGTWDALDERTAHPDLLVTNAVPEAVTGLLVACAMIVLRALTLGQAYKAVSWTTVILVAAMIPLATAMRETGAAEALAETLVRIVGDAGPYALLVGLFALTATLGQLISNMATALVVSPIAVSAAATLGVAAAASFLTPVATPVNLMVKEPGGYRFGDYRKLGLPLLLSYFVVTIAIVPLVWPF